MPADQVMIYQGSMDSPTFLCAFDNSQGQSAGFHWASQQAMFSGDQPTIPNCLRGDQIPSAGGWHQSSCTASIGYLYFGIYDQWGSNSYYITSPNADGTSDWNSQMYSALPPGLTIGVDALEMATYHPFWAYAGTTTGSPTELRAAIADLSSWIWSDSTAHTFPL
eukprot:859058-Prymnesium_polylepis.1